MIASSKLSILYFVLLFVSACSGAKAMNVDICESEQPHTLLSSSGYEIKIFNPNDLEQPDIWEGPICIRKAESKKYCLSEYSLIKDIQINDDLEIAEVTIFSGSNSEIKRISLATCQER